MRNIESLGLRASLGANIRAVHGNYAGTVQQRLDDLHAAFRDPEVKAIWAIRGGSGCISLLALLDYALIQRNPKVLIGYSDITALHLAIGRQTGLVTFHGPVASSTFSDYTVTQLRNVLMTPQDSYTIPMALDNHRRAQTQPNFAIRTVHGGQATGRLTGGNLCMVSALAGTPYAADFREHILFLEEINEVPYRIDRMLCQLDLSIGFKQCGGIDAGHLRALRGGRGRYRADPGCHPGPASAAIDGAGRQRLFVWPHPPPVHATDGHIGDPGCGPANLDLAGAGRLLAYGAAGRLSVC